MKKSYVYFILNEMCKAVKIGKADDIYARLIELQIGSCNELKIINSIECNNEEHAYQIESALHKKYKDYSIRGEWFQYLPEFEDKNLIFELKKHYGKDVLENISVYGDNEIIFDNRNPPRCFFYNNVAAQILDSYEKSLNKKIPYRTMIYPTNGKKMLLPYSHELNRVFISHKKHEENCNLKRFLKESEANTLDSFFG